MTDQESGKSGLDLDRPESLRLRHRPVQRRGRVRFETILAAARHLLMDKGIEGFVVEDVAEYAEVPVGSVYQFFPNKLAIVAELAHEDTTSLTRDLTDYRLDPSDDDLPAIVESMIGLVADRWREDPSRSAVWLAMKSTAATRAMAEEQSRRMAAALIPALQALGAQHEVDLQLVADVIIELSQSIMLLAYRGDELNEAVVSELERVIRGYLRAVARNQ